MPYDYQFMLTLMRRIETLLAHSVEPPSDMFKPHDIEHINANTLRRELRSIQRDLSEYLR